MKPQRSSLRKSPVSQAAHTAKRFPCVPWVPLFGRAAPQHQEKAGNLEQLPTSFSRGPRNPRSGGVGCLLGPQDLGHRRPLLVEELRAAVGAADADVLRVELDALLADTALVGHAQDSASADSALGFRSFSWTPRRAFWAPWPAPVSGV